MRAHHWAWLGVMTAAAACGPGRVLEAPAGLTATALTDAVEVRWDTASTRDVETVVTWRVSGREPMGSAVLPGTTGAHVVLGLEGGVTYGFWLTARGPDGRESSRSAEAIVVPLRRGSAPPDDGGGDFEVSDGGTEPVAPDGGSEPVAPDSGTEPVTPDAGSPDAGRPDAGGSVLDFQNQFISGAVEIHMRNGGSGADYRAFSADFTGDGRADVAVVSPTGGGSWNAVAFMELSTATGVTPAAWTAGLADQMRTGGTASTYFIVTGDFNGDKKADLAAMSPNATGAWSNTVYVELSTGTGFTSAAWACGLPQDMRNGGSGADYRLFASDVNGDGKSDLVVFSPNGGGGWNANAYGCLSTGSGLTRFAWPSLIAASMRTGGAAEYRLEPGDYDGDGKGDMLAYSPNAAGDWGSSAYVDLSTGDSYAGDAWATPMAGLMRANPDARFLHKAGDFNGDGQTDIAWVSPDAQGGWRSRVYLDFGMGNGLLNVPAASNLPDRLVQGGVASTYWLYSGDVDGDGSDDLLTLSPNATGAWATAVFVERWNGSQLLSTACGGAHLPEHIRGGGSANRYLVMVSDLNGDKKLDLSAISPNGLNGWTTNFSRDLAR